MQATDTLAPFVAAMGFLRMQIVEPGSCMGVQKEQGRRLAHQALKHGQQHDVLVHICKVAGVKGVAVVHGISAMGFHTESTDYTEI